MPRVLITGAAGFIGMHSSIKFLNQGWDVIGLDNFSSYYSVSLKRDRVKEIVVVAGRSLGEFVMLDADLNSHIWASLESYKFDAVVHLAAQAGVRYSLENPGAYIDSNILGFQSVMDFVEKQGIASFIYASSSSVYGKSSKQPYSESESCNHPESFYAATKKSNEMMAYSYFKTKGVNSIGLRFFTVYGPWGRPDMAPFLFANAAYTGKSINVFNHGNQKRDFTYIDDIVEGIYLSVKYFSRVTGAEVFNIGCGSPTWLLDFIEEIELASGNVIKRLFVDAQLGDVDITYANTQKFETTFGFSPMVGLKKGVAKFIEWFESYYEDTIN
jgi:UDP-glucuronate 4-epimerase